MTEFLVFCVYLSEPWKKNRKKLPTLDDKTFHTIREHILLLCDLGSHRPHAQYALII